MTHVGLQLYSADAQNFKSLGEQRQLGVRVNRRSPRGRRVRGSANLEAGICHRHVEVVRNTDDRTRRQTGVRPTQADSPWEPPCRESLFQTPRVVVSRCGTSGDVRPNLIVVERGEQRISVTLDNNRRHLNDPAKEWG